MICFSCGERKNRSDIKNMTMAVDTCQKPTYLLEIDSYFLTDFLMNIMDLTVRIILCAKEIILSYNKT